MNTVLLGVRDEQKPIIIMEQGFLAATRNVLPDRVQWNK
jgi:hypothetical protein